MEAIRVAPPPADASDSDPSSSSEDDGDVNARGRVPRLDADVAHVAALLAGGGVPACQPPRDGPVGGPGRRRRPDGGENAGRGAAAVAAAAELRVPPACPGPRSTATTLHCATCDCFVPRRPPSAWTAHTTGMRHRRSALGAALTGGARAVAVTPFEPPPLSKQKRAPQADASLLALRTAATTELLRHVGVTDGGASLAERFSVDRLATARATVAAARAVAKFNDVALLAATPATLACVAALLSDGWMRKEWSSDDPSHPSHTGPPSLRGLTLALHDCHAADAPAVAAGLVLLARSLARNACLKGLRVDASAVDGGGGGAGTRLWRAVLVAFGQALSANTTLDALVLRLPSDGGVDEPDVEALRAAASTAPAARRAALLMAAHHRAAGVSLFAALPVELMVVIADAACGRRACSVLVSV